MFKSKRVVSGLIALMLLCIGVFWYANYKVPSQRIAEARIAETLAGKYADSGKLELAIPQYEKALALREDRDNRFILAILYLKTNQKEAALPHLEKLAKGTDDNAKMARDTIARLYKTKPNG